MDGTLFLLGWYAFFFVVALGGFVLGRRIPVLQRAERVPWESYYVFLSIVGLVGTAYSYAYVFAKSPHAISQAFLHHQFNAVRYVLPYSAGFPTLRYAIVASPGRSPSSSSDGGDFRLIHVRQRAAAPARRRHRLAGVADHRRDRGRRPRRAAPQHGCT